MLASQGVSDLIAQLMRIDLELHVSYRQLRQSFKRVDRMAVLSAMHYRDSLARQLEDYMTNCPRVYETVADGEGRVRFPDDSSTRLRVRSG
jgi:hypothetical protein